MYILIFFILGIGVGALLAINCNNYYNEGWRILGYFSSIVSFIVILFMLILIIYTYKYEQLEINKYNQLVLTLKEARSNPKQVFENATLTKTILDYNANLVEYKYWNNTQWDWWYSDKIAALPFIK